MYGDNVEFDEDQKVINKILERKTFMKRPKVSNISKIIFVISSKMPKPNLLMLDKWLAYAEFLRIKPVIVINKIDLPNANVPKVTEELKRVFGFKEEEIILCSGKTGEGVPKLIEEKIYRQARI